MPPLPDILIYIALPVLFIYFLLFNKTIKMLEPHERTRYVKEAGSKVGILSTVILFGALVYFDDFKVILIVSALIIASTFIGTIFHHKKLKELNFDSAFEKRLLKVSFLSGVGILLILGSFVLNAVAT